MSSLERSATVEFDPPTFSVSQASRIIVFGCTVLPGNGSDAIVVG